MPSSTGLQALRSLSHPNIVACKELLLDVQGHVNMVFELVQGGNLEKLARQRSKPFTERQISSVCYQLLKAAEYMHSQRYLHRDIKPENILLQTSGLEEDARIKLADLGLAKRLNPGDRRPHTTYVATRWYRSPEILLHIGNYGFPSDMWAIGAVIAELVRLGDPLFPGRDEDDQLARIVALRGHPAMVNWKTGEVAMKRRRIRLPRVPPSSLKSVLVGASLPVVQLISDLLELDPDKRPTAVEALNYPLFVTHSEGADSVYRSAKRRKLSSEKRDTARSGEYPPTAFTYRSGDNVQGAGDENLIRSPRCNGHSNLLQDNDMIMPTSAYPSVPCTSVPIPFRFKYSASRKTESTSRSEDLRMGKRKPAARFNLHVFH